MTSNVGKLGGAITVLGLNAFLLDRGVRNNEKTAHRKIDELTGIIDERMRHRKELESKTYQSEEEMLTARNLEKENYRIESECREAKNRLYEYLEKGWWEHLTPPPPGPKNTKLFRYNVDNVEYITPVVVDEKD